MSRRLKLLAIVAASLALLGGRRAAANDASLTADFNRDHAVDGRDLTEWCEGFGGVKADADGNGHADGLDFLAWQRQLGQSSASPSVLVPEPTTGMVWGGLAGVVGLGLVAKSRIGRLSV